MSKSKLLELLTEDDENLCYLLDDITTEEFRDMVILAIKEQDRDTRNGCAQTVQNVLCGSAATTAHSACIAYTDPTLRGL